MQIDIRWDVEKLRRDINASRKQVPYATLLAINSVLKASAPAVAAEMQRVFDRPTPWTLNSYRVLKFTRKDDLVGVVGFKNVDYNGGPGGSKRNEAGVYLQPLMSGTTRQPKGLERLMRSRGILYSNEFLVPSKFQKLDAYGNVSRGVIQKITANLSVNWDPLNNTPAGGARGGKKKPDYFFTRRGVRGQRITAIWQNFGGRGGQRAVPVFIVIGSAPQYKKIFDHEAVVQRQVDLRFHSEFESAYAQAIATAR